MVTAKIVERRPQNSRPGLPQLRSRKAGLEAGAQDVREQRQKWAFVACPGPGALQGDIRGQQLSWPVGIPRRDACSPGSHSGRPSPIPFKGECHCYPFYR